MQICANKSKFKQCKFFGSVALFTKETSIKKNWACNFLLLLTPRMYHSKYLTLSALHVCALWKFYGSRVPPNAQRTKCVRKCTSGKMFTPMLLRLGLWEERSICDLPVLSFHIDIDMDIDSQG